MFIDTPCPPHGAASIVSQKSANLSTEGGESALHCGSFTYLKSPCPQAIGAFHAESTFADYFFVKASFTATSADWSAETVTARSPGTFVITSAVPFDAVADASA